VAEDAALAAVLVGGDLASRQPAPPIVRYQRVIIPGGRVWYRRVKARRMTFLDDANGRLRAGHPVSIVARPSS